MQFFFKTENFDLICNLIKQYGDFIRVWIGPELNIVVRDPKDVEVSKCIFKLDYKQRNYFFAILIRIQVFEYYGMMLTENK